MRRTYAKTTALKNAKYHIYIYIVSCVIILHQNLPSAQVTLSRRTIGTPKAQSILGIWLVFMANTCLVQM